MASPFMSANKCLKNNEENCDNITENEVLIEILPRLPPFNFTCVRKSLSLPSHIENSFRGFLLCSSTNMQNDYFVYNPTNASLSLHLPFTLTSTMVVRAALVFDDDDSSSSSSSSNSNVYRVIRFSSGFHIIHVDIGGENRPPPVPPLFSRGLDLCIDIYSSKTGQWAMSKASVQNGPLNYPSGGPVFFDGAIYMLCGNTKYGYSLLRFDVREECREFISLPAGLGHLTKCLGVCGGRLCYARLDRLHMEVWALEDCESRKWALKHDVDIQPLGFGLWEVDILAFHPTLAALFLKRRGDDFYWHNFETGKLDRIVSCSLSTA